MEFPCTLYSKSVSGHLRTWIVWVEGCTIVTDYGVIGGARQQARKAAAGKNTGRSNATSPEAQALKEAEAMVKHRLDRKFGETPETAGVQTPLPMLAHSWDKRSPRTRKNQKWPVAVQPKFDGCRCLAVCNDDATISLLSREGLEWSLPHLQAYLRGVMSPGQILDGELYLHGRSLQQIISLAKNAEKEERNGLQYRVYDMPRTGMTDEEELQEARFAGLLRFFQNLGSCANFVIAVETDLAYYEEAIVAAHDRFVEQGYEGAIVRNFDGAYGFGGRSHDLLKVVRVERAEFKVVHCGEGRGKSAGKAIWFCQMPDSDATFKVKPKCSQEEAASYWENRLGYIGKMLTVEFRTRTDAGIPKFAKGIAFRPEEDLKS